MGTTQSNRNKCGNKRSSDSKETKKEMKTKNLLITAFSTIFLMIFFSSLQSFNTFEVKETKNFISKRKIYESTTVSLAMHNLLEKYSSEYDIPKYIAYNISYLETRYRGPFDWNYKPNQISCVGALGAMQIMPGTAKLIEKKPVSKQVLLNNIELNIQISMKLLRKLHNKYKDWSIVCGCYNTGKPIVNDYARFCVKTKDYTKNWVNLNRSYL